MGHWRLPESRLPVAHHHHHPYPRVTFPIHDAMNDQDGDIMERPAKRRRISSGRNDARKYEGWNVNEVQSQTPWSFAVKRQPSKDTLIPTAPPSGTPPPPEFTGSFDLYHTNHESLYQPQGSAIPQHEELYRILCTKPSPHATPFSHVARCYLPSKDDTHGRGLLESSTIRDPASSDLLHTIYMDAVTTSTSTSTTDTSGAGINAALQVFGGSIPSDIIDSFGEFKIRRIWAKIDPDNQNELFEGQLSLNIFYGEEYESRGCMPVIDHQLTFWAIRQQGSEQEQFGRKEIDITSSRD